jgi:hypothetical protein
LALKWNPINFAKALQKEIPAVYEIERNNGTIDYEKNVKHD